MTLPDAPDFALRACQRTIWGPRVTSWQCFRKGVAQEREVVGGKERGPLKWWCNQHLPSSEKKRDAVREERYRAGRAVEDRKWARREAEQELMAWARTQDELPSTAQEIVDRYEENV